MPTVYLQLMLGLSHQSACKFASQSGEASYGGRELFTSPSDSIPNDQLHRVRIFETIDEYTNDDICILSLYLLVFSLALPKSC
jgi:hypothetical protein